MRLIEVAIVLKEHEQLVIRIVRCVVLRKMLHNLVETETKTFT